MSRPAPKCYIPLGDNRFTIGRRCIVCGEGFDLMGLGDPRTICPDCCKAIDENGQIQNWKKKDLEKWVEEATAKRDDE